jgi:hypothetical protein
MAPKAGRGKGRGGGGKGDRKKKEEKGMHPSHLNAVHAVHALSESCGVRSRHH